MDGLSVDVRTLLLSKLPDSRLYCFRNNIPPEVYTSRPHPGRILPRVHILAGPKWDGSQWVYKVDGLGRMSEAAIRGCGWPSHRRSVYSYQVHGAHYRGEED